MIAKIAVSAALFAIDKPYSYEIPPELTLEPGMRVLVPFGRGNRSCEGIVLQVEDAPAGVEAGLRSGARVFIVPGMLEMPQEFEARCTRINSLWELPARLEEA